MEKHKSILKSQILDVRHGHCVVVPSSLDLSYMHLSVVVAKRRDISSINEVRYIDVRTKLNLWEALQGLTKNPGEEGRRECTSLFNAGATLKR